MKKIERPDWYTFCKVVMAGDLEPRVNYLALDKWFAENVEPINKMIEDSDVVYGWGPNDCGEWRDDSTKGETHQALLWNPEPIETECEHESCADIAKEYTNVKLDVLLNKSGTSAYINEKDVYREAQKTFEHLIKLQERAKRAIERESDDYRVTLPGNLEVDDEKL